MGSSRNQLRNAPLFGYGLFPNVVIRTAEQDIANFEATGHAPRPSPGASQQSSWRSSHRYQPYDKKNADQPVQGSRNSNHGGSLVAPGEGAITEVVAQTPVFLGHLATSNIDDNYLVCSMPVNNVSHRWDKNLCQKTLQTVNPSMLDS